MGFQLFLPKTQRPFVSLDFGEEPPELGPPSRPSYVGPTAFRELTELAIGDLKVLAGLREFPDVGAPLFRAEIDRSVTIGAGRLSARI